MQHQPIAPDAADALDYTPVTLARTRHDGWTAERQRIFLCTLAETGCISEACHQAGINARSAYRLRRHPEGERFATAWDLALRQATAKLMTLAFERAVRGSVRELWRDDQLVAEARQPSDRMLTYLLSHLAPANAAETTRWAMLQTMADEAGRAFTPLVDALEDCEVAAEGLTLEDYAASRPLHGHEPLRGPDYADEEEDDY
ncbi:MAG: hypothetical protein EOP60_04385 [Sphingomonadales bacterium]|nr:MAG: hypothetical protein EOP60_04385 [Sphingomonadales bacterium]